jgi:hypothetical protein
MDMTLRPPHLHRQDVLSLGEGALPLQPEHPGYTRPVNVRVQKAHALSRVHQRHRQVHRHRALAYAPFARENEELVGDPAHAGAEFPAVREIPVAP